MKRTLIINGHPTPGSFCQALAEQYHQGALSQGQSSALLNLHELNFNPNLNFGYQKRMSWEPDLEKSWDLIKNADHLVFVYPNWWGTYPALMKGFIDRLFLPGMAFGRNEKSPLPTKLLKGKTARVMVTMDSPAFYYRLFTKQPGHRSMERSILNFVGIKPVKFSNFYGIKKSEDEKRKQWLNKSYQLGVALN